MGWPTPQEYNEAIQNPRTAFADGELRAGQPVLTALGLPRPITGAFASVYQLVCPQRTWAVRCFLREYGDHQERYAAISEHLARVKLPYMVPFTFLTEGIRVNGRWYPILKMEWVEGESLHTYVEHHLDNPPALLGLAEQWVQMARTLRQASIGHGDLQHGNVLVVDHQLRLIDYDGMYVPPLAGRSSHEIGHRNYQHPQRTEADFGPQIDHFSTWVVYTALVALSVEPKTVERARRRRRMSALSPRGFSESTGIAAVQEPGDNARRTPQRPGNPVSRRCWRCHPTRYRRSMGSRSPGRGEFPTTGCATMSSLSTRRPQRCRRRTEA